MERTASSLNYDNVCRLCLSTRGETQPIFSSGSSSDETASPVLASKIEECVAVKIDETDGLPTQICKKCVCNVNNWHIFKKVCNDAQVKLRDWVNSEATPGQGVNIKKEPFSEELNDDEIMIDASYPGMETIQQGTESLRLQPEGPPILASLGLAPRNEKEIEEDDISAEEDVVMPVVAPAAVPPAAIPRRPVAVAQLASKDCLVCGRAYRYSHNARRHELTSHSYDRYTNKVKSPSPTNAKLRPNPYNPKARLLPNPINPKISGSLMAKTVQKTSYKSAQPYPVRIRSLADLQNKSRQPEILKSLLTARPEILVSEPEIVRSRSESPETLISEPELAAFQVETIISEPDTYVNNFGDESDEDEEANETLQQSGSAPEPDSDEEVEISPNLDINKIIGIEAQSNEQKGDDPDVLEQAASESDHRVEDEDHNSNHSDEESDGSPEFETHKPISQETNEEEEQESDSGARECNDDEDDEDMPPVPLAPIVEINENPDVENNDNELEENAAQESINIKEISLHSMTITPTQKSFMTKYRDVIEQVNTMKCNCCDKVHPRRKAVIQHLQKNGLKVPKHTCYNCVITFGHIGALLSHMRANVCTDAWKLIYEEGGIPDSMISEATVTEEYKIGDASGREDILNKSQYKDILNARSYACKLCPAKFQLKQFIMKHILDVHENGGQRIPLCCIHCKYRFKDNRLWKKHIRNGECTVHIACELCNEKFRSLLHFNDHALAVHAGGYVDQSAENLSRSVDGRPTDCPICHKNTSSYHNLVKHLKAIHNEEKPHMCQHCDQKFGIVTELNHHIYKEHSDRVPNGDIEHETEDTDQDQIDLSIVKQEVTTYNYSCTDCSSMFDSVDGWTQHQIDAHNHKAYECDQCDKKFLQDSELIDHKNSHLRVKFYSCTVCSNSYSSPQRLSEHMIKNHPGESSLDPTADPFYCEMCMRSFKSRQAFSNHMRIHAKVPTTNKKPGEVKRPVEKSVSQSIPHNITYRNSPKSVTDAPYSCDICGKGFLHKKNIWKHKKILHPEVVRRMELENSGSHFMNTGSMEEDEYTNDEQNNSTGLSIPQFDSFTSAAYDQTDNSVSDPGQLYQCDLCDKKFAVKSSIWKHKRVKHGIVNPNMQDEVIKTDSRTCCTICKINFNDKRAYYRHRKNVHRVNTQSCKICGKGLNSTLELYEHYKAAHAKELLGYNANQGNSKLQADSTLEVDNYSEDDEETPESPQPEDQYQARYPCDTCGKTFVGMMALQNHNCVRLQNSASETFDCEICNKSYTSISALKSHRGWHLRSPDGKAAFSSSGLWMPHNKVTSKVSKHEVLETPRQKHSTPIADSGTLQIKRKLPPDVQMTLLKKKKISNEVTVELVQKVPRSEEGKACLPCGKEFTKRAAYMRHMEEVHRPNSVFCPICNKSFTRRSTLIVHMRKHGGEESAHEGESEDMDAEAEAEAEPPAPPERLYRCDLCNVRYTTAKSLRRHCVKHHNIAAEDVVVEVGGTRHKCGQCGEEFASDKEMWQHRHYSCTQCGMFFSRQQYLTAHMRARHQQAPAPPVDSEKMFFPCNMCDRFYMNKKSLQRHVEVSH